MADNNSITHLCQVCGIQTTYWCSRCHGVWYCSVEHMQMDWPTHRQYCQPYQDRTSINTDVPRTQAQTSPWSGSNPSISPNVAHPNVPGGQPFSVGDQGNLNQVKTPTSPTGNTTTTEFDAVLFPWNEERPRIIRVSCLAQPQASGPTIWTPLPQEPLGGIQDVTSMIITNGIGGAPLRFPLHLFYGTNSFGDGSPINRTINRMTGGKATYPWAGNIVALKFSGSRRQGYTDATYNDVAPLIASFLAKPDGTS